MIGLLISVLIAAYLFMKFHARLTPNQILHIWVFSFAFHQWFDVVVLIKHQGYWYFSKEAIEWKGLIPYIFLVPPINIVYLNQFPFQKSLLRKVFYIFLWTICIFLYELFTLLPEPWGFFHYGWWKWWYSILLDPILLFIVLMYYHLIQRVEKAGRRQDFE
ncbi:hypothetical protein [Heyndrickxia acidicola]|uniref:Uncharacterized protein n=1 Tax=Heyndrickxia acidicola TaxID=209389 RepID=A0ABU6MEK1_9BACI|nr:hypothetical protein [Heyndrickxia acidicola]MED1203071.1 hypothetical protein [Heyndrickxia acidicola]